MHVLVPRRSRASLRRAHPSPNPFGDVDRLFDVFWRGVPADSARAAVSVLAPRMDYTETEAEIRLAVELPGFEEEDIRVSFEDGVVTIAAERKSDREEQDDEKSFRHVERFRGRYERKVRLPAEVEAEAIRASHRNGLLTVVLPKVQAPAPRSIPVTVS